jgi:nucleoside-diphosphate-sugar epimerase
MSRSVVITGADGFIGTALAAEFGRAGWQVSSLVRNAKRKGLASAFEYSIDGGPEPGALRPGVDVVLHAAFQTQGKLSPASAQSNLAAAGFLADWAQTNGALFVFISSMSAHDGAFSAYGRVKRQIELSLNPAATLTIRPGFVVGPGGSFRRSCRTLNATRLVPMPYGGGRPIQTADVAELARAVFQLASARGTGLYSFGEPEPITMRQFYQMLAAWLGKPVALLPCPGPPVLAAVRLCESVGLKLPITSENLLGLKGLIPQPVAPAIEKLGWRPASFSEILERYDPATILGGK